MLTTPPADTQTKKSPLGAGWMGALGVALVVLAGSAQSAYQSEAQSLNLRKMVVAEHRLPVLVPVDGKTPGRQIGVERASDSAPLPWRHQSRSELDSLFHVAGVVDDVRRVGVGSQRFDRGIDAGFALTKISPADGKPVPDERAAQKAQQVEQYGLHVSQNCTDSLQQFIYLLISLMLGVVTYICILLLRGLLEEAWWFIREFYWWIKDRKAGKAR